MKIAIIAGRGDFPIQIAKENPDAFVLCIEDHSCISTFKNNFTLLNYQIVYKITQIDA